MNEIIKNYIDKGIDFVSKHKEYLMYEQNVHPEMILDFDYNEIKEMSTKVELEQQNATGELLDIINQQIKFGNLLKAKLNLNKSNKSNRHLISLCQIHTKNI